MRVYLENYPKSRAICRIETALRLYAPPQIEFVATIDEAELVIMFVFGRLEHRLNQAFELFLKGKKYVVIQLSLTSTRNPNPVDWTNLWINSKLVWSYYDLPKEFNFYHAPLGADPKIFNYIPLGKRYIICTTGNYNRTECLYECEKAAKLTDQKSIHPIDVSDEELNRIYNSSHFVSGLRHKEGFEMPAVEGLFCGCLPIMFDTPNYRQWFDGYAEFIPEGTVEEVIQSLVDIFSDYKKIYRVIGWRDQVELENRFDWGRIVKGFWERCL
jgi:hypothetical protein